MPLAQKFILKIGLIVVTLVSVLALASPIKAELPRTQTIWQQTSGDGGVNVYPYIWGRQSMAVDFES